ncbi:MAG TPA: hypothetical protein VKQ10_07925 [Spirochaetota bacterium]|nr:hypothetical protein [Spirochaetota bacterium]
MSGQHVHLPGDDRHICKDCRPVDYGDVLVALVLFVLLLLLTLCIRKKKRKLFTKS